MHITSLIANRIILAAACGAILICARGVEAASINLPTNLLGMVGYWTFDGKDMAQNVADVSGNGNHGRIENMPATTTIPGIIGQAIWFDGDNDNITMGDRNMLQGVPELTVSVWVKMDTPVKSVDQCIVCYNAQAGSATVLFQQSRSTGANKLTFSVRNADNTTGFAQSTSPFRNTGWSHLVGVYNGTNVLLYIDGELQANTGDLTGLSRDNSGVQNIGGSSTGGTNYQGGIDEVRFYARALSEAEIDRLYMAGASRLSGTQSPGTLTNGLIGHWTMDGKDMTPNVRDVSGQGNHGNLSGQTSTTTAVGKSGQAMAFDGVDDRVTVSSITHNVGTGDFTWSAWVYPRSVSNNFAPIMSNGSFAPNMAVNSGSGSGQWGAYWGGALDSGNTLSPNTWYHLVLQRSGTTLRFYQDGVQTGNTHTVSTSMANGAFRIGNNGAANWCNCIIDDARFYNRALSVSEIQQLHAMGGQKIAATPVGTGSGFDSGLVGYWPFDGKYMTPNVRDASGNGNHGNLSGQTSTTTAPGKLGQALSFDGTNDEVVLDSLDALDFSQENAFSIAAWVWPDGNNTGDIVFSRGAAFSSANSEIYYLGILNTDTTRWNAHVSDGTNQVLVSTSVGTVSVNEWQHMVLTWDGVTLTTYKNGVALNTGTNGSFTSLWNGDDAADRETSIGAEGRGEQLYFDGRVDDVRAYNRTLSASEVKQLYNMGR